jgi:glycosyltransferase involved in cell wall biosynthesis
MRRFRPQIVHTHTAKAGVLGRLAARLSGVPATVHTFHGHLLHGYFSPRRTKALVQVERALAPLTTRLVAVGSRVRDELLAAGIGAPHQFAVVPPGTALSGLSDPTIARKDLGLPTDGLMVGYIGRLTRVKQPQRFLEIASRMLARHPGVTFVIAGEGTMLEELRRLARPLGPAVRFLGWRDDVATVYSALDLVVLTSDNEGMPVSLIETALAGLPAVTTDVGSAAEVVLNGVTGLVTSTTVDDLAAAVESLLVDAGLRAKLGRAAALRARRQFSPERLIDDTEALYEEIATARGLL